MGSRLFGENMIYHVVHKSGLDQNCLPNNCWVIRNQLPMAVHCLSSLKRKLFKQHTLLRSFMITFIPHECCSLRENVHWCTEIYLVQASPKRHAIQNKENATSTFQPSPTHSHIFQECDFFLLKCKGIKLHIEVYHWVLSWVSPVKQNLRETLHSCLKMRNYMTTEAQAYPFRHAQPRSSP